MALKESVPHKLQGLGNDSVLQGPLSAALPMLGLPNRCAAVITSAKRLQIVYTTYSVLADEPDEVMVAPC
jgi:hypothetical protein